jgi:RNA polymerase sigma-70 factor (ECF subfamily)
VDGLLSVSADGVDEVTEVSVEDAPLAFEAFYRLRRDRIARALAMTVGGDTHLGAEATDEAMARAFQRWDRVATLEDPGAWVYRVGLNWATSVLRRRQRAPRPLVERDDAGPTAIAEPDVLVALAELDVKQRAVVVCRYYLGLSEAETASALRIRPGTVKSRLHRALRNLQPRLAHLRSEESS